MQTRIIGVVAIIILVGVAIAVGLTLGYFNQSHNSIFGVCTVVSFSHSYSYNPFNNSSYIYTNTTLISALETYTQTNVHILNSSQGISTATGTTLTYSGIPGIAWNETICAFSKSVP